MAVADGGTCICQCATAANEVTGAAAAELPPRPAGTPTRLLGKALGRLQGKTLPVAIALAFRRLHSLTASYAALRDE